MKFSAMSNHMEFSFVSMITEGTCSFTPTHACSFIHVMNSCRIENAVTSIPTFLLFLPFVNHGNQTFPIISSFILQSIFNKGVINVQKSNGFDPIECLQCHLREINLNNYRGYMPDVSFAKFFVLFARVLKLMRFYIKFKLNDKWWATQQKRLLLHHKGSEEAQFEVRAVALISLVLKLKVLERRVYMTCPWLIHLLPSYDHATC